ncbi:MAG: acetyltransferase [Oscillospiraceae bacterium]|nr:acetyltransferase [Oscillospiraceae bacterium]
MVKAIPVPIRGIIGTNREINLKSAIQSFCCRDNEVENFLKHKAFDFEVRHKSRTYLIIDEEQVDVSEPIIYGYFTLTMKTLELGETLSKSTIKRIDGFSKDVLATEAILLGQLGKNQKHKNDIEGQSIIDEALDTVYDIHKLVGGRIVFLECDENPKLVDFYKRSGFEPLQKCGEYLQMIKYL